MKTNKQLMCLWNFVSGKEVLQVYIWLLTVEKFGNK